MIKKFIPLAFLFTISMSAQVVKDTIYSDTYNYITNKENATYFSLTTNKNDDIKNIETYKLSNNLLISKGKAKTQYSKISYYGDVNYYTEDGKLQSTFTYDESGNLVSANSTDIFTGDTYYGKFSESESMLYDGKVMQQLDGIVYFAQAVEGDFKQFDFINPKNDKNKISYSFNDNGEYESMQYYDEKGNLKHSLYFQDQVPYNGTSVEITPSEFIISSINTYKEGEVTQKELFYTNGKLKSKMVTKDDSVEETTYDKNGKIIGHYSSVLVDGYQDQYTGTVFYFNYADPTDEIQTTYKYDKGNLLETTTFYSHPKPNVKKSVTKYDSTTNYITEVEYYDINGKVKSVLTYQDYMPFNGTSYEDDSITNYKDGEIISQQAFYSNSDKIFEKRENDVSIYYDKSGKEIGRAYYERDPYENLSVKKGTVFTMYDGKISSAEKYEKGQIVYRAEYNTSSKSLQLKSETFYTNNIVNKVVNYYNNGKIQEVQIHAPNYYGSEVTSATYYDKKGKELGKFDFEEKNGTKIEFYNDNQVKSIEKFINGKAITAKKYLPKDSANIYDNTSWSTNDEYETALWNTSSEYYLFYEIDFNKSGKFFNSNGEVISTVTYKDGAPYNGIVHESDGYQITETPFKNGLREGIENQYSIYNTDNPYKKVYYSAGEKTKEENFTDTIMISSEEFQNELRNGFSIKYDDEGNEISRIEYKNDYPYEGAELSDGYEYKTQTIYQQGDKIKTTYFNVYNDTTLAEEIKISDNHFQRTINNEDANSTIKFELVDGILDGKYQYIENDKVKYNATFSDGKLKEGTIVINDLNLVEDYYGYSYDTYENHTIITYKKNVVKLSIVDNKTGKELYQAETKIKKGNNDLDPILSKVISIKNLYPSNNFFSSYY
ncbi:hypothetical protein [Myroides injenensis]|uniref:hypothetical protein n=1 Tax=Myroides injenensis TaxID=1183151 RepID=UPI000288193F|nr:hypothetical protein [Myroides injenensis]